MSFVQRLILGFMSKAQAGAAEAESKAWRGQCPHCGVFRQPDNFAGRPDVEGELHRFVDVAPDTHVGIETFETDPLVSGHLQHVAHHVRAGHGKGARPAMHGIGLFVRNDGNNFFRDQLGVMQPGVVFTLAPDDLRELAPRFE